VGYTGAMFFNTTGSGNVANGHQALEGNTIGNFNTVNGYQAMKANQSGINNVANGSEALLNNLTGNSNVANGYRALVLNTSGINNVANGSEALYSNTTGFGNVANGYRSLYFNITGANNVANGFEALYNNTASANIAIGYRALYSNTTGNANIAIGIEALRNNTGGTFNIALGQDALKLNTSGGSNIAIGALALRVNNGQDNIAIGTGGLQFNSTGIWNVSMGASALGNATTGNENTCVGHLTMIGVTAQSRITSIGSFAEVGFTGVSDATAIGAGAIVMNSNNLRLGNTACTLISGNPAVYTGSDARFKTNVVADDVKGLDFIRLLRPVVYNFDTKKQTEFITKNMPDSTRKRHLDLDFGPSTAIRQSGFIAQEVEKAAEQVGYNFHGVHKPEHETDYYSLAYSTFVVPLVKAVQEMDKQKTEQDQKITSLMQQLDEQKQIISDLQKKVGTTTGVDQINSGNTTGFSMSQNEPNPFTHETIVKYTLPKQVSSAYMAVYDLSGKQVTTFAINQLNSTSITITSEKLAAGIYIYSIIADGKVMDSKRMIIADK
jgi:trimeric autotransporter adhesin